jgi:hypothetical protein
MVSIRGKPIQLANSGPNIHEEKTGFPGLPTLENKEIPKKINAIDNDKYDNVRKILPGWVSDNPESLSEFIEFSECVYIYLVYA